MAVQAQYYSNTFAPDLLISARNNVFDGLQQLQQRENGSGNLFGVCNNFGGQQIFNGTVFSDPESELTCNISGSRKRNRDDQMALPQHQISPQQQLRFANLPKVREKSAASAISTGLQLSYEANRLNESRGTSTSGRSQPLVSNLSQDVISYLYHQNIEVDTLIQLQNEKLRSELEETRKRHCRSLLSVLEQQIAKRIKEKETELENANRRNAELEEKVKQMIAENQIWFNVAKNNEAIVTNLRTSLEQILIQNSAQTKEGYGDTDCIATALEDDAGSCCYEEKTGPEISGRKTCKVCHENDVSVLLLPCRHLCLCKDCESKNESCPICNSVKNASLQIFMS
eukprot:TRINITY_DN5994_c0_g4_i1.p1 TRINITY_DN5994_c0_g4~~TRINITY_DN5994_c0_g4_i1.p1  ORF type:complete len:342 (+),score=7.35 TRINITY_DN5994_c0_g4_i1:242-1267(+)